MNRAEDLRHCGQRGCRCTHGLGLAGVEATCDKGWVDTGINRAGNDTVGPCYTCYPAKYEAVARAVRERTSLYDALVSASTLADR